MNQHLSKIRLVLLLVMACTSGLLLAPRALAQVEGAGESAHFAALDTSLDHQGGSPADLEPECMDCGEMLLTEQAQASMLKAGARPPSMLLMSDVARLTFRFPRPSYVAQGPTAKVQNRRPDLFEVKTKARAEAGASMVEMEIAVNPAARDQFPDASDAAACDPKKPFDRKQKGWFPISTSSSYETKSGYKGASSPQTTYLCVHKPVQAKPACTLSCGHGTCQQAFTGAAWMASCACEAGYRTGADGACVDVNECKNTKAPCPLGSSCINTAGSFICGCRDGKVASAGGCVTPGPVTCSPACSGGASCLYTPTSTTCVCPEGQRLTGGTCSALKQCALDSCGPSSKCTDSSDDPSIPVGDIRCSLPPGTAPRLSFDTNLPGVEKREASHHRRPVDIDECKIASVRAACGANACVNLDRSTPVAREKAAGATCGSKRFPPAPSLNATWNDAGMGTWVVSAKGSQRAATP